MRVLRRFSSYLAFVLTLEAIDCPQVEAADARKQAEVLQGYAELLDWQTWQNAQREYLDQLADELVLRVQDLYEMAVSLASSQARTLLDVGGTLQKLASGVLIVDAVLTSTLLERMDGLSRARAKPLLSEILRRVAGELPSAEGSSLTECQQTTDLYLQMLERPDDFGSSDPNWRWTLEFPGRGFRNRFKPLLVSLVAFLRTIPVSGASASYFVVDNFNDGDYTLDPSWEFEGFGSNQNPGSARIENGELIIDRIGSFGSGGGTYISMPLSLELGDRDIEVSFDVKCGYSDIRYGTGDVNLEWCAAVLLELVVADGANKRLLLGFNYRGGQSGEVGNTKVIGNGHVQRFKWLRGLRYSVKDYFPDAVRVTKVQIGGAGWNYSSFFDNISLTPR